MTLARWINNFRATPFGTRRRFPGHVLQAIEKAITTVEAKHAGEIRFVVETSLDFAELWAGCTPRQRAIALFGSLGVWDTANNNGVLIYVLMAERVSPAEWEAVCRVMEAHFRDGRFREGSLAGIEAVGELLAKHFPQQGGDRNEQPNRPVLL